MRLKNFKGLPLGKLKEKEAESGVVIEGTTAEQLTEMQKKLNGRKKDLEDATRQIQDLASISEMDIDDDEPIGPHGPIQELTLEDIPEEDEDILKPPEDTDESVPAVQMVKIKAPTPAGAPGENEELQEILDVSLPDDGENDEEESDEEDEKQEGETDLSNSFSDLFGDDEDDENPLAALIKNMPDVSAQELIDDIAEIKGIIKEWQHSRF